MKYHNKTKQQLVEEMESLQKRLELSSQDRYRRVFQEALDMIHVVDINGRIVDANAIELKTLGYAREEYIGKTLMEIVHPDCRDEMKSQFEQVLKGHILKGNETIVVTKEGLEINVEVNAVPEMVNGKVVGAIGVLRNISDRKFIKQKLVELSKFPSENPNPVLRIAKNGEVLYQNEASHPILKAWDYKKGKKLTGQWKKTMVEVLKTETAHEHELEYDGRIFSLTYAPVVSSGFVNVYGLDITKRKDAENKVKDYSDALELRVENRTQALEEKTSRLQESQKALTFLLEDVNEYQENLKIANEKLELVNKELEAFAYSVSHDLRAPLRHIFGFSELLQERIGSDLDAKSAHQLNNISEAALKMGILIDDLLLFSRVGRSEIYKRKCSFMDIVKDVRNDLEPELTSRNIVWKVGSLPEVYADFSMIRQAMFNLLSNAVKFTKTQKEASIEIGSLANENEVVIYIKDNGVGFDIKYVDKVFEVFHRLHKKEEFEGTGIGMANVQRIIEKHGGRIWAESEIDKGATFYFSLPQKVK